MRATVLVACLVALAVCAPSLAAPVSEVYSNLGPGDTFSTSGYTIAGASAPRPRFSVACRFGVSGGDYHLVRIEVAGQLDSGTNSLIVSLLQDNAGQVGAVLESITIDDALVGTPGSLVTAESLTNPLLTDGSFYWVSVEAGGADTVAAWFDCEPIAEGFISYNSGSGWSNVTSEYYVEAYRVSGAPVPEPATLSLLGLGLAGFALRRTRFWRSGHSR